MFDIFERNFTRDAAPILTDTREESAIIPLEARELIRRFGGCSFRSGLYRTISAENYEEWMDRLSLAFPKLPGTTAAFGYDWQGDVFVVNSEILVKGKPGVLLFEIGSAEALELPFNIEDFHDKGLIEDRDKILTAHGYKTWLSKGGAHPSYDECIGYKIPLFLGGKDDYGNLELSDIDVYWHIMGQIMREKIWSKKR